MQHCNSLGKKNIRSSNVHSVLTRCRIALKKERNAVNFHYKCKHTEYNIHTSFSPFFFAEHTG